MKSKISNEHLEIYQEIYQEGIKKNKGRVKKK